MDRGRGCGVRSAEQDLPGVLLPSLFLSSDLQVAPTFTLICGEPRRVPSPLFYLGQRPACFQCNRELVPNPDRPFPPQLAYPSPHFLPPNEHAQGQKRGIGSAILTRFGVRPRLWISSALSNLLRSRAGGSLLFCLGYRSAPACLQRNRETVLRRERGLRLQ